ncbi:MAG TPA: hypothetical protein VFB16_00885 [Bauldia sp.]|nr:hypothetical protein [Bauldia sp.]
MPIIKPVSPPGDTRETASYVEHMSRELRLISERSGLKFLAYLLAMAEDEARATFRRMSEEKPRA